MVSPEGVTLLRSRELCSELSHAASNRNIVLSSPTNKYFFRSTLKITLTFCNIHPGFDSSILRQRGIWGRQMKQCWIKYWKNRKIPLNIFTGIFLYCELNLIPNTQYCTLKLFLRRLSSLFLKHQPLHLEYYVHPSCLEASIYRTFFGCFVLHAASLQVA